MLDLGWDASLGVTEVTAGPDGARMNLFRAELAEDGTGARVILTDSRKLSLPVRGSLVHLTADGDGEIRILAAEGAGNEGEPVEIEIP